MVEWSIVSFGRYLRARLCVVGLLFVLSACQLPSIGAPQQSLSKALEEQLAQWQVDATRLDNHFAKRPSAPASTALPEAAGLFDLALSIDVIEAPVESVLRALAADAAVDLHIKQALHGAVTLQMREKSLESVLRLIALQAPIFWQWNEGALSIWGQQAYSNSYAVDYLNLDRTTVSSVGLATQVGSISVSPNDGGTSVTNSSQTLIQNQVVHRFWDSLKSDLDGIQKQFHEADFNDVARTMSYTINRDAGLITLHADAGVHLLVQQYLKKLNGSSRRQVLIEATVVEVTLSDKFDVGIDWQFLADGSHGLSAVQKLFGTATLDEASIARLPSPSAIFSLVKKSSEGNIGATMTLLQQFGDVRILSRPRVIALNNQSSVLKVVDNRVYFTLNVERKSTDAKEQVITQTEIHTVPVGLVMNVTPYIGDDNEVMLNVRPSMSRIIGFVNDPNPQLAEANVKNGVPEIQVREMESMLRVQSGELAVIGGLMQDVVENHKDELPGLATLPGIGHMFSSKQRRRQQTELLVVLRPTVMSDIPNPL